MVKSVNTTRRFDTRSLGRHRWMKRLCVLLPLILGSALVAVPASADPTPAPTPPAQSIGRAAPVGALSPAETSLATTSVPPMTSVDTQGDSQNTRDEVQHALFDGNPAAAALTQEDRARITDIFMKVGRQATKSPTDSQYRMQPQFSIGFGWYIYFHHITPTDQKFFLTVEVAVIAGALCVASEGTLCPIATTAATILIAAIAYYYNASNCVEVQLNYNGTLHNAYPTVC